MQKAKNEYRPEHLKMKIDDPMFCEKLFNEYNNGFRAITGAGITDISF